MKSRSGALLKNVIDTGKFTADDMARELTASREDIESYVSGEAAMPLERQLSLALLVIEQCPRLVRRGHTLRAQVAAAMAFRGKETATHSEPPSTWISMFRRGG
jgi:hypothetical protein